MRLRIVASHCAHVDINASSYRNAAVSQPPAVNRQSSTVSVSLMILVNVLEDIKPLLVLPSSNSHATSDRLYVVSSINVERSATMPVLSKPLLYGGNELTRAAVAKTRFRVVVATKYGTLEKSRRI